MPLLALTLIISGLYITHTAWKKSKSDGFYTLTPQFAILGIYVWGDGLVLGPFWSLSGLIFLFLSPLNILRYVLLFYALRSAYEVIYWLNHQAVKDAYRPPLLPALNHLSPKEVSILYQLTHFTITFLTLSLLTYTVV